VHRVIFSVLFAAALSFAAQTKNIVDMTGRAVSVPAKVEKVVTAGATPAVNAFLFALGKGDTIQNGMPGFMAGKSWRYQAIFAPKTASQTVVSGPGPDWNVNVETLATLQSDVVFVGNKTSADMLAQKGFCVVSLYWSDSESIKKTMVLLGDIMGVPERAKEYVRYYDDTLKNVASKVSAEKNKPKALYIRFKNLTLPMVSTATWMFENAGGINVARGVKDHAGVSAEQILGWNPDFLFVWSKEEVDAVYKDQRFKALNAVKNKKVFAVPMGAHVWTHYTPEQPLAVIWAAQKFYPSKFKDTDIKKTIFDFYSKFFGYKLSDEQINDILNP
jgi:iron complex transport system substrate-binding protein